eukprot:1176927-Prorocentrum_minimum.AAC.2
MPRCCANAAAPLCYYRKRHDRAADLSAVRRTGASDQSYGLEPTERPILRTGANGPSDPTDWSLPTERSYGGELTLLAGWRWGQHLREVQSMPV